MAADEIHQHFINPRLISLRFISSLFIVIILFILERHLLIEFISGSHFSLYVSCQSMSIWLLFRLSFFLLAAALVTRTIETRPGSSQIFSFSCEQSLSMRWNHVFSEYSTISVSKDARFVLIDFSEQLQPKLMMDG